MKYLIGSGFHSNAGDKGNPKTAGLTAVEFFPIWWDNTRRYSISAVDGAEDIIVLATGNGERPKSRRTAQWIDLAGDLGHVHDLNEHRKPYHWCGWSISLVTLALLAYNNECDFFFKEQDVLAFGPWVERMYAEIGSAGMIFGRARCMPAVQSLLLCKHEFIPEFVRLFMSTGSEQEKRNEGELKFARLERDNPGRFARFSFGYDRDRPINYDDLVFYGQHWSADELKELRKRGLV